MLMWQHAGHSSLTCSPLTSSWQQPTGGTPAAPTSRASALMDTCHPAAAAAAVRGSRVHLWQHGVECAASSSSSSSSNDGWALAVWMMDVCACISWCLGAAWSLKQCSRWVYLVGLKGAGAVRSARHTYSCGAPMCLHCWMCSESSAQLASRSC